MLYDKCYDFMYNRQNGKEIQVYLSLNIYALNKEV